MIAKQIWSVHPKSFTSKYQGTVHRCLGSTILHSKPTSQLLLSKNKINVSLNVS
jgi:hypothetical protein